MGLKQQNLKFEDVIWELIDQFWKVKDLIKG
jgi:hypothetical protein